MDPVAAAEADLARRGYTRDMEGLPDWLRDEAGWRYFLEVYARDPLHALDFNALRSEIEVLHGRLRVARRHAEWVASLKLTRRQRIILQALRDTGGPMTRDDVMAACPPPEPEGRVIDREGAALERTGLIRRSRGSWVLTRDGWRAVAGIPLG